MSVSSSAKDWRGHVGSCIETESGPETPAAVSGCAQYIIIMTITMIIIMLGLDTTLTPPPSGR